MSDVSNIPKLRTPVWVYLLLVVLIAFLLLAFAALIKDIIIQYKGRLEVATITEVPLNCKWKFDNTIKVKVDGREYPYSITRTECTTGKYQVGQQLKVRRHAAFNKVIRADDRADYSLAIYFAWLVAFFFIIRYSWRWYQKVRRY